MTRNKIDINHHLFYETSHSPSLIDIVGEEMLGQVIDFCFIENPYYPGEKLMQQLQEKLPVVIKSYPSSNPDLARKDLASVVNVKPEYLTIGNGATELITIIQNKLVVDMGIPVPTFSEYIEKLQSMEKVKLFQLPAENGYQLDLNLYAEWLMDEKLSAALIINPGNPTGQFISIQNMLQFMDRIKHMDLVLLDESFIDFAGEEIPSLMPYVDRFPNLLIVRSMSKHCGVPGLRLGYCCTSNQEYLEKIREAIPVWNINTLAEYFLTQLKSTNEEYHIARNKVIADVEILYNELCSIKGFKVYPTGSNFIMLKIESGATARQLQLELLQDFGVYVRDCSNKTGLDKYHIRISSKGRAKDVYLISALKKISDQWINSKVQ